MFLKKVFTTAVVTLFIFILLLLPDLAMYTLGNNKNIWLEPTLLVGFILFSLALAISNNNYLKVTILIGLFFIQLVQTLYIGYFGSQVFPAVIANFFHQTQEDGGEVFTALINSGIRTFILPTICIISYLIIYLLTKVPTLYRSKFANALMIILIIIPIARATLHPKIYLFYPNQIRPTLYNSLNTFALIAFRPHNNQEAIKDFKDYQIIIEKPAADNIIVVMGESSRDDYMGVLGYEKDTTPNLMQHLNEDNFIAKRAISGSVSTSISLPLFFNVILEPGNQGALLKKTTNLFKLAKNQGYKTILISMQSSSLLSNVGGEYVDHLITREEIANDRFELSRDELLLVELKKIPLKEKNFIVLHMRSQHSPYAENYKHRPELAIFKPQSNERIEIERAEYANAMRFNDLLLEKIISFIKSELPKSASSYMFFTSDHGEMLGEQNLYGHHHLQIECARVPFILYGKNVDKEFNNRVREMHVFSHYDIALLIANRLGIDIFNPNIKNNSTRYIHGANIETPNPHLEYDLLKQ